MGGRNRTPRTKLIPRWMGGANVHVVGKNQKDEVTTKEEEGKQSLRCGALNLQLRSRSCSQAIRKRFLLPTIRERMEVRRSSSRTSSCSQNGCTFVAYFRKLSGIGGSQSDSGLS